MYINTKELYYVHTNWRRDIKTEYFDNKKIRQGYRRRNKGSHRDSNPRPHMTSNLLLSALPSELRSHVQNFNGIQLT